VGNELRARNNAMVLAKLHILPVVHGIPTGADRLGKIVKGR
jgi:hypothetical protein